MHHRIGKGARGTSIGSPADRVMRIAESGRFIRPLETGATYARDRRAATIRPGFTTPTSATIVTTQRMRGLHRIGCKHDIALLGDTYATDILGVVLNIQYI